MLVGGHGGTAPPVTDSGETASSSRDVASDCGAQLTISSRAEEQLGGRAPSSSLWKWRTKRSVKRRQKAAAESAE